MRIALSGLCIIGLVVGAIWLCWLGLDQMLCAKASKSWPSVTGTVISAGFKSSGAGKTYSRKAYVQYRYMVNGAKYTNDRITFGPTPNFNVDGTVETDRHKAIKALARQSGGDDVSVYYDPGNPVSAVLLRGGGLFFLIYLLCSALMFGFAGMVFLLITGRAKAIVLRR